ncbi:hypothetical protein [Allokutzneria oryzae]|uniref:YD repeat-containing protein n=1 Tax=Allokutzneria oryzae TaxID=1378989 RepID=A0ABV6A5W1_9PSEU
MNDTAAWATEGKELKADPNTLKGFATNLATIGENLKDDNNGPVMGLFGGGDDVSISSGTFAEGKRAMDLDSRNAREMMQYLGDQYRELLAHSAATHVLADMYETGANNHAISLNAIMWAYQEPGATPPGNVPPYLYDEKGKLLTMNGLFQEAGGGGGSTKTDVQTSAICLPDGRTITEYRTADGGTRVVTKHADGKIEEVVKNDKGDKLYEVVTTQAGATTTFYQDNKVAGSTVRSTTTSNQRTANGDVEHEQTTFETRDAEGKVTSTKTEHMVTTTNSGDNTHTRDYYTTKGDDPTKTDQRHIGSQPAMPDQEDWQDLAEQESERARNRLGGW